MITFPIKGF